MGRQSKDRFQLAGCSGDFHMKNLRRPCAAAQVMSFYLWNLIALATLRSARHARICL